MATKHVLEDYGFELMAAMVEYEDAHQHPTMLATYNALLTTGWTFHITNTRRGRCRYTDRTITVPVWAWHRSESYRLWYLCHEMAHAIAGYGALHGPEFMAALQRICPPDSLGHEVGYKPKNAMQAGIAPQDF